ncbi:MAG: DinB family protein [Ferruginibacter sp.]
MHRNQEFLRELTREAAVTRKMLTVVPNDKFDWKPHPKSMNIRQLAGHIAELPSWVKMVINTDELDFAENAYVSPDINETKTLLALFEKNLAEAQDELAKVQDEILDQSWTLRNGDQVYSKEPKADVIRMSFSQIIHHRAQLGVFLRLLDVAIPGSYGPSADDASF